VRYADGTAFRRALADRLRRQYPDQDVGRLQKRVAMERFLARVVAALPEHARLKGGYALELRLERARATQDLDVALRGLPGDAVLEALRDASELDLGDHLRYRIEETSASRISHRSTCRRSRLRCTWPRSCMRSRCRERTGARTRG
jgi:hypothetical protein